MNVSGGIEMANIERTGRRLSQDNTSQTNSVQVRGLASTDIEANVSPILLRPYVQPSMTEPASSPPRMQHVEETASQQITNDAQEVPAFDQIDFDAERNLAFYRAAVSRSIRESGLPVALAWTAIIAPTLYAAHRVAGDEMLPFVGMISFVFGLPSVGVLGVTVFGFVEKMRWYHNDPASLYVDTENGDMADPSEFAYGSREEMDAQKIRQSLEASLSEHANQANMANYDALMVRNGKLFQDVYNTISNHNDLALNDAHMDRLAEMLVSNAAREIRLVWSYLQINKTGEEQIDLKRQFVDYLAKSEGCAHGRENQVLLFFQGGIDTNVNMFPVGPKFIRMLPKNDQLMNELKAEFAGTLTQLQRHGSISIYASDEADKAALKNVFVDGQPYGDVTPGLKMTNSVFNQVYKVFKAESDLDV